MFNVCSKWLRAAFSLKISWCHPDVSSYVGPWKQLVCSSAMCFPFHCWLVPHWHSAYCCIGYCPPVWMGAGCRSHYVSKMLCKAFLFYLGLSTTYTAGYILRSEVQAIKKNGYGSNLGNWGCRCKVAAYWGHWSGGGVQNAVLGVQIQHGNGRTLIDWVCSILKYKPLIQFICFITYCTSFTHTYSCAGLFLCVILREPS